MKELTTFQNVCIGLSVIFSLIGGGLFLCGGGSYLFKKVDISKRLIMWACICGAIGFSIGSVGSDQNAYIQNSVFLLTILIFVLFLRKMNKNNTINLRRILRTVVVAEWLLMIAYISVSYNRTTWVTDVNVVVSLTMGLCVVVYIISSIGLFFFMPWAKWAYISLFVFSIVLELFTGPLSVHRPDMAKVIGGLSPITAIVILCMLLFTNVISKKKKLVPHINSK